MRNGMGLGMLLCLLADDERDLVRLAEPVNELDTNLWILTHPAMKGIARIKAFTDSSMRSCARATSCFTPVLDSVLTKRHRLRHQQGQATLDSCF